MSKEKYVISVGAGRNQLSILRKLIEKGYKVVAFDKNPNAIGKKYCTYFSAISTWEYQEAYEWLNNLNIEYIGVVCMSCFKATYTQHYLIAKFNLKNGIPTNVVDMTLDKREILDYLGINNKSNSTNIFLLKDSQGLASEGISYYDGYSQYDPDRFYLEPYYQGEERRLILIYEKNQFKIISEMIKSNYKDTFYTEVIKKSGDVNISLAKDIISKLNVNSCILKIDYIIHKNEFKILEIDFDIPGDYFEEYLSNCFFNYDYLEFYLGHYLNGYIRNMPKKINECYWKELRYLYDMDVPLVNEENINCYLQNNYLKYKLLAYNEISNTKINSNNDKIAAFLI